MSSLSQISRISVGSPSHTLTLKSHSRSFSPSSLPFSLSLSSLSSLSHLSLPFISLSRSLARSLARSRFLPVTHTHTYTLSYHTSGTYRQNAPMTIIVTSPGLLHLQCIHRSTLPITDMSHCHEVILTDVQPCHVKSQFPTLGWLKLE